ncbi:MAG TPA: FecR domain-containing protein [Candidatus Ozemobacteraceae bacterium]|nr:FecR domain-containing protein [Candidatus Ozemobacteraceae bacterium]
MKRGAWFRLYFPLCFLLAGLIACSASVAFCAGADETMTFQLLRGRAALSRNGGSTWLDLGPEPIAVRFQDMLRSEGEARAELSYSDGSLLRIRGNTRVTLLKTGVQLQVGECWFALKKQPGTFQVTTPTTLCGVLGTTFDVAVDRFGRTRVRTFEGIVSVRAHGDARNRQLVLQRGMMAIVNDREQTGEAVKRFDPAGEDARMQSEWKSIVPMKIGPGRAELPRGLPPMKPSTAEGWKPVYRQEPAETAVPAQPEERTEEAWQETSSARASAEFFRKMRDRRLHLDERREDGGAARDGLPPETASVGAEIDAAALSESIGARFGQARSGALGATGQPALREEYLRNRSQLVMVQQEITRLLSEIETLKSRLNAGGSESLTADQIRERLSGLTESLKNSRERQSMLFQRLENVRNRLR